MGAFSASSTIAGAVVIVLAVLFTILRFVVRTAVTHAGLKADDWLILFAVLITVTIAVLLLHGNAVDPNGQPFVIQVVGQAPGNYTYTPEDRLFMEISWISSLLYFSVTGATKIAVLIMYHRIFARDSTFHHSTFVAGFLAGSWWLSCTIASLLNCRPIYWAWSGDGPNTEACFPYNNFWFASGILEVLIDTLILFLPIRAVWKLQLSQTRRASIVGVFLLGGFVVITGLVRTILAYVPGGWVPSFSSSEIWGTVHAGVAIICACLPIMAPLFTRIGETRLFTRLRSTGWTYLFKRQSKGSYEHSESNGWQTLSRDKSGHPVREVIAEGTVEGKQTRRERWERREWNEGLEATELQEGLRPPRF